MRYAVAMGILALGMAQLGASLPVAMPAIRDIYDAPNQIIPPLSETPCLSGPVPGTVAFSEDFEAGINGWTTASTAGRPNLWHWTTFRGNNSAMDDLFHGAPGRMHYGIENAFGGTYNTQPLRNQGEIRSPPLVVPSGLVAVAFNTKWHVEFDRAWLIDSMNAGYVNDLGQRSLVCYLGNSWAWAYNIALGYSYFQNSPTGQVGLTGCRTSTESFQNPCRFIPGTLDDHPGFDLAPLTTLWESRWFLLPAALSGQTIQLTFYFQTGDAIVDDAMGWMIDDINVVQIVA